MIFYFVDLFKHGDYCWVKAGPFINLDMAKQCKEHLDKTDPAGGNCEWKVVEREFLVTRQESYE